MFNKNQWENISIHFFCPLTHITLKKKTDIVFTEKKCLLISIHTNCKTNAHTQNHPYRERDRDSRTSALNCCPF